MITVKLVNKMAEKISTLPEFKGFTNEDIINHFKWLIKKGEESLAVKMVNKLNNKGFTLLKPWSNYGKERIYWSNAPGYFEITEDKKLKVVKLEYLKDIILAIEEELKNNASI